jgi:hypothetical protein
MISAMSLEPERLHNQRCRVLRPDSFASGRIRPDAGVRSATGRHHQRLDLARRGGHVVDVDLPPRGAPINAPSTSVQAGVQPSEARVQPGVQPSGARVQPGVQPAFNCRSALSLPQPSFNFGSP